MPTTNAIARLPRFGNDFVGSTTFYIPRQSLALLIVQNLSENNRAGVLIINMCSNFQATIAEGIEWKNRHIEVDEIGIIAVDGIECAIVEIGDKLL